MNIEAKQSRVVKVSDGVFVIKPRAVTDKPQQWTVLCTHPEHGGEREIFVFSAKPPRWKVCLDCFKRSAAQALPLEVSKVWAQATALLEAK